MMIMTIIIITIPKTGTDSIYVRKGRKEVACYKMERNIRQSYLKTAEYPTKKYTEDRFVNILKVKKAVNQILNQPLKEQQKLQKN